MRKDTNSISNSINAMGLNAHKNSIPKYVRRTKPFSLVKVKGMSFLINGSNGKATPLPTDAFERLKAVTTDTEFIARADERFSYSQEVIDAIKNSL